jgi:hypothetical protein
MITNTCVSDHIRHLESGIVKAFPIEATQACSIRIPVPGPSKLTIERTL